MSEEFILKMCWYNNLKNGSHIEKIYSLVYIFLFCVYFFKLELILFYNTGVYYYTRIFLILLPHPIYIYIYICVCVYVCIYNKQIILDINSLWGVLMNDIVINKS